MKDILGTAISDYYRHRQAAPLWVRYRDGSADKMDPAVYFRTADDMPELERVALRHCRGRILEIGAGAGSHALLLQEQGLAVTALDLSPKAVSVMEQRGVRQTVCADIFDYAEDRYDTLLLLMNGIGLTADMAGLHRFLDHARGLLQPGGRLLFDSSDVAYLYGGQPPADGPYYGEIPYRYEYKLQHTDWSTWLYIDARTLTAAAEAAGWNARILYEDGDDQYLACLRLQP